MLVENISYRLSRALSVVYFCHHEGGLLRVREYIAQKDSKVFAVLLLKVGGVSLVVVRPYFSDEPFKRINSPI